jgi:hypothetical protein
VARVDILERSVSEFVHPVLKSVILFLVGGRTNTYVVCCYEEGRR